MWTWFNPAGSQSNDDVAATYVLLILRGLMLSSEGIDAVIDPAGRVRAVVYEVLDGGATPC